MLPFNLEQLRTPTSLLIIFTVSFAILVLFLFLLYNSKKKSKAFKALYEHANRQLNFFRGLSGYWFKLDREGVYTDISEKAEEILGFSKHELIGKSIAELHVGKTPLTREPLFKLHQKNNLQFLLDTHQIVTKSEETIYIKSFLTPILDTNKQIIGFDGFSLNSSNEKYLDVRYQTIIKVSNTGAWEYNVETKLLWTSPDFFEMLGYEDDDAFLKKRYYSLSMWVELMHPDDQEKATAVFDDYLNNQPDEIYENFFRLKRKDGSYAWICSRGQTIKSHGKKTALTVGTHIDISKIKQLEERQVIEREYFKKTLVSVSDGVIVLDQDCRITLLNETIKKWAPQAAELMSFDEAFHFENKEGEHLTIDRLIGAVDQSHRIVKLKTNSFERILEYSINPIQVTGVTSSGWVLVCRDVTERREKEHQVKFLSEHDQLTGLYNRRRFDQFMNNYIQPEHTPLALVMVDANGLKVMNDVFGHLAGDDMLKKIAYHLNKPITGAGSVYRIGGDEFIITLPNATHETVQYYLKQVKEGLANDQTHFLPLTVSHGYSFYVEDKTLGHVYREAENYMYQRKIEERSDLRKMFVKKIMEELYRRMPEEQEHAMKVSELAASMAEELELSEEDQTIIKSVALHHDIGKIVIDHNLLYKEEPLTELEKNELRRHTESGYSILSSANFFAALADPVLYHHEHFNGDGYPKGLKGHDIPLFSRIIHLAEAYDHLRRTHSYREGYSKEKAIEEIKNGAGKQFDPEIVAIFLKDTVYKY